MREITDFVRVYDAYFLMGLAALVLILLISNILLSRRLKKIHRRRDARLEDARVGDIVDCLGEHFEALAHLADRMSRVESKQDEQAAELAQCLRRVGIVRFDAFDDVGGEQSFALALMDANKRGVIVSSIYGRQDSRFYAKEIVNGSGDRALSDEEKSALDQALS